MRFPRRPITVTLRLQRHLARESRDLGEGGFEQVKVGVETFCVGFHGAYGVACSDELVVMVVYQRLSLAIQLPNLTHELVLLLQQRRQRRRSNQLLIITLRIKRSRIKVHRITRIALRPHRRRPNPKPIMFPQQIPRPRLSRRAPGHQRRGAAPTRTCTPGPASASARTVPKRNGLPRGRRGARIGVIALCAGGGAVRERRLRA